MEINTGSFCTISTNAAWHDWLKEYDEELFGVFIDKLSKSKGCSYNSSVMSWVLSEINGSGGTDKLITFLSERFPHVIKQPKVKSGFFSDFNPAILSFPRKHIIRGRAKQLPNLVAKFVADKLKSDHVIVGDVAYIEYLTLADKDIANKIPSHNWRIASYRKDN